MRIIAGIYRGRVLKSPPNLKTRPTSDRLRETVFNILNPRLSEETNFLDLCAGTGAIGIEALSREVKFCTFVEISRKICGLIEENLDKTGIPENKTEIICEKSEKFLAKCEQTFDIVYFDPPYQNNYFPTLIQFGKTKPNLLKDNGILIAEHSTKIVLPDLIGDLRRWRIVKQGDSSLSFYEKT